MRNYVLPRSTTLMVFAGAVSLAMGCGVNAANENVSQESARVTTSFVPSLSPSDVLSPDSVWYNDVSASAVASNSASILSAVRFGGGKPQVDFSIKVMQTSSATPKRVVQFSPDYTPDSDASPVPVPNGGALEEETGYACTQGGDCHLIVIDTDARKIFELWNVDNTSADGSGTWSAVDQTEWLMDGHYGAQGRGLGCTSADAAGLSVTAGLIGVREASRGQINHAIRFILPNSGIRKGKAFISPATHGTSATSSATGPAYGTRLRLRASFDESKVTSKGGLAVVRALKKYGMILADAGQDAFTAESDAMYAAEGLSWNGVLAAQDLSAMAPTDFDVVDYDESKLGSGDDCTRAPAPSTTPRSGTPTPTPAPTPAPTTTPTPAPTPAPTTTPTPTPAPTTTPTPPPTSAPNPPSATPNLLSDGAFESGASGFELWPGHTGAGDVPARTTSAIDGTESLAVTLPDSNWVLSTSIDKTGTGALHASAKLRNDGTTATTVNLCAGVYDQAWAFVKTCAPYTLTPGQTVSAQTTYAIASSTKAQMALLYVTPADGKSATLAVDDAYAAYSAN